MKDSRRSPPTGTSSTRARAWPSTAIKTTTGRIADKMQRLALRRPNMLHLIEQLLDGLLSDSRRDDDPATIDD